jgi:hypothetical protein
LTPQRAARGLGFSTILLLLTFTGCGRAQPDERRTITPLNGTHICISHAVFKQSFHGGEFGRDGVDFSTWRTAYAWGRTNPGAHDAAYYVDPLMGRARESPFSIDVDPAAGGRVLAITARPLRPHSSLSMLADYASGTLQTWGRWQQRYGYFEARMRLPKGQGLWPAFWLLDASGSGNEWDVVESFNTMSELHQGLHIANGPSYGAALRPQFDPSAAYHTYGVLLLPGDGFTTFYVDGEADARVANLVDSTRRSEYMIVGLQVGGNGSWPGEPDAFTVWPATLRVQYVRAYLPDAGSC